MIDSKTKKERIIINEKERMRDVSNEKVRKRNID